MTGVPNQQAMIREAMESIAQRRPGTMRLVYDKTKRTIVAVSSSDRSQRGLDITAEDADMFVP